MIPAWLVHAALIYGLLAVGVAVVASLVSPLCDWWRGRGGAVVDAEWAAVDANGWWTP